jgi:hypothetical protein
MNELLREARGYMSHRCESTGHPCPRCDLESRIDAHFASQPDCVAVMVDVNTILVVMRVLTFLKGVLIGLGFKPDSSSINQLEIAYSMLRDAPGVTE